MELLTLEGPDGSVRLAPALGGAVALWTAFAMSGSRDVLRPWNGDADAPFALGCNLLAPFSNRISGGGFEFEGVFCRLVPNLAGERYPIHGDAFQKRWSVAQVESSLAVLELANGSIGPFKYAAEATYRLEGRRLSLRLDLRNIGETTLPFGGGFHPWFPRTDRMRLDFSSLGFWQEDAGHLPTVWTSNIHGEGLGCGAPRSLPSGPINNALTDWYSRADVLWPETRMTLAFTASPPLTTAIVYSPGAQADFFCFEPVSHAVDALNTEDQPGLVPLAPGEAVSFKMSMAWSEVVG